MKKASVLRLSISAILMAAIGYGATLHAQASTASAHKAPLVASKAAPEDLDLVGVVGDVMVDGCTSDTARCNKAWKDLGNLADKNAL